MIESEVNHGRDPMDSAKCERESARTYMSLQNHMKYNEIRVKGYRRLQRISRATTFKEIRKAEEQ